ncbi:hypothetical protein BOX15_Mlig006862g1 [Macrostomum lignano]|uniref:WSC domain-containing protein n=1 Tax=Macrostomum lignano TaxID=282301 RepID=A0A267EII3_9PLAT|nr:hypothetical protein BOX15_Mlig006862g1 [Macrostomum lignano]
MLVNQRLLTALFFILSLVCLEIQACPPILPVIAGAFTGIFAAGRAVGSKRSQERPATKFKGCYADSVNARDMGKASFHSESLTHVLCRDACKKANMKHMGLQNGTECYCANKSRPVLRSFQSSPVPSPEHSRPVEPLDQRGPRSDRPRSSRAATRTASTLETWERPRFTATASLTCCAETRARRPT